MRTVRFPEGLGNHVGSNVTLIYYYFGCYYLGTEANLFALSTEKRKKKMIRTGL